MGVDHGQPGEEGSPFCSVSDDEAAQTSALFACVVAFTSLLVRNAETYSLFAASLLHGNLTCLGSGPAVGGTCKSRQLCATIRRLHRR